MIIKLRIRPSKAGAVPPLMGRFGCLGASTVGLSFRPKVGHACCWAENPDSSLRLCGPFHLAIPSPPASCFPTGGALFPVGVSSLLRRILQGVNSEDLKREASQAKPRNGSAAAKRHSQRNNPGESNKVNQVQALGKIRGNRHGLRTVSKGRHLAFQGTSAPSDSIQRKMTSLHAATARKVLNTLEHSGAPILCGRFDRWCPRNVQWAIAFHTPVQNRRAHQPWR